MGTPISNKKSQELLNRLYAITLFYPSLWVGLFELYPKNAHMLTIKHSKTDRNIPSLVNRGPHEAMPIPAHVPHVQHVKHGPPHTQMPSHDEGRKNGVKDMRPTGGGVEEKIFVGGCLGSECCASVGWFP